MIESREQLTEAMNAIVRKPAHRQLYLDLGHMLSSTPNEKGIRDVYEAVVYEFLAGILKQDPKNPVLHLNLAAFATALTRLDIARDFSDAAIKLGKNKLEQQPMALAKTINSFANRHAGYRNIRGPVNPLIEAAHACGIINSPA